MEFEYPSELPISAAKDRIVDAVRRSQVVIVSGQTGSGKTTQIPKMLLEMGRGAHGRQIVHTQPRRIAARAVAERLCQETGARLGREIGYQVRFTDESAPDTRLRIVTDGILLAQIQRDPHLSAYDTIVIDEAHERSLNIDFLLGYLTELLPQRRDLKLVITSATIDSEKFQKHFQDALGAPVPIIEVSGRTYPVQILYEPAGSAPALCSVPALDDEAVAADPALQVARAVAEFAAISRRERGARDILVFASGERDIRDFEAAIRSVLGPRLDPSRADGLEILPLFARLSGKEQHRVFDRHGRQRVIIATNVAETSLTVPGIRYVVDPGTARVSRYSKSAKVQRLPIEPVSQASADQRAGRTGRVADGIAIRLYSKEDYDSRPRFTDPEILRTSLGSVVLHMLSTGVARTAQDVTGFGFIDPPDTRSVADGIAELTELGAIRRERRAGHQPQMVLTRIGRQLARLPIDERLGRMIVEAHRSATPEIVDQILVIVSFLSLQDPRERPVEKREEADRCHSRFADESSDFLTILNLWDSLFQADGQPSNSALRKRCAAEYLSFPRVRQWLDLYHQLTRMCRELRFETAEPLPREHAPAAARALPAGQQAAHSLLASWDGDAIHRSMLAGLLSNIGMQLIAQPKASDFAGVKGPARARALKRAQKSSKNNYQGARNTRFALFPASALRKSTPQWVMAGELMETSRLWARNAAAIDPAWAADLGRDLTKTTYSAPRWSASRGAAVADATVLLYGLPVVSGKTVQWGRIDPAGARQLLIRQGLVEGHVSQRFSHDGFLEANRAVLEESQGDASRTRRIADAASDEDLFEFYDRVLPPEAVSLAALAKWWQRKHAEKPHLLDFDPQRDVDRLEDAGHASADDYPSVWKTVGTDGADISLDLTYEFKPGQPDDGITAHVPLEYLERLRPAEFTWLVPGFRGDLVTGLVKVPPKQLRVQFVPAPDSAAAIRRWIDANIVLGDGTDGTVDPRVTPFTDVFARAAIAVKGAQIHPDVFDEERLSRLPNYLRMRFAVEKREPPAVARRKGSRHGRLVKVPPTTLAAGTSLVRLQRELADQARQAARDSVTSQAKKAEADGKAVASATILHQAGATDKPRQEMLWDAALAKLRLPSERVSSRWLSRESLTLASAPYRSAASLVEDLQRAAVKRLLPGIASLTTDAQLEEACGGLVDTYEDAVYAVAKDVIAVLQAQGAVEREVSGVAQLPMLAILQNIREHLASLVHAGFIGEVPSEALPEIPRYIKADETRLNKAKLDKSRDVRWAWQAKEARDLVDKACKAVAAAPAGPAKDAARQRASKVRWMYEEFRVSLWAQELGSKGHPSVKRMTKILEGE